MKKLFKNEDGTLKVINIVVFVDVVVAVLLLLMVKNIYGNINNTVTIIKTTTTSKTTTTIDLCRGCKISFKNNNLTASPKSTYVIEDLLNMSKVTMNYVDFDISDKKLANITTKNGKKILEIFDTVGTFTITAKYYSKETSMVVNISSDKVMDIEFENNVYYVKVGYSAKLKYDVIPKGLKDIEVSKYIENHDIAEFDADGNIKGRKIGKTFLTVSAGGIIKNIPIYVVNSDVTLKVKEGFIYRDVLYAKYDGNDIEILLILENTNYSNKDITYEVISDEDMRVDLEYIKKNTDNLNAYEYTLKISSNKDNEKIKEKPKKGATILFTIPDGSVHELRIEVENSDN